MLIQAGYRGQSPLFVFLGLRFGLPFVFGSVAAIYFYLIQERVDGDSMKNLIFSLGAAFAGFYLPLMLVKRMVKSRQLSITQAWPARWLVSARAISSSCGCQGWPV